MQNGCVCGIGFDPGREREFSVVIREEGSSTSNVTTNRAGSKQVLDSFILRTTHRTEVRDIDSSFEEVVGSGEAIIDDFPDEELESQVAVELPNPREIAGILIGRVKSAVDRFEIKEGSCTTVPR